MASIKIYSKYTVSLPGTGIVEFGSNSAPYVISLDATAPDMYSNRVSLADNAEATLIVLGSGEDMADFKAVIVYCSVDMTLGLRGATDANNSTVKVKGGTFWHVFSDDLQTYDAVTLTRIAETTTTVDCTQIYVGNNSGSTGYCQIWAVR